MSISHSRCRILAHERRGRQWANQTGSGQYASTAQSGNGKRYSQTGTLKFSDPTVDETTGSVTLRAIFPNPNGDLLPGMYVTALVDEGSRQNVLLVPQEGVTHNAQGKATALILDKDDVVQLREIEASKAIGDQWVVTSGLQAGDRVIVSGLQRIRPGIKARAISSSQENASTESKQ